jgi:hypothetical protein
MIGNGLGALVPSRGSRALLLRALSCARSRRQLVEQSITISPRSRTRGILRKRA